jgi:hypothetical protein
MNPNHNDSILSKITHSFIDASHGRESINNLIWRFGLIGYLITFFIINKIILINKIIPINILLSLIPIIYFSWHIFALIKCTPKKPVLSKEDKLKQKQEHQLMKSFFRKLFLQESLTKSNPILVTQIIDILFIINATEYIWR